MLIEGPAGMLEAQLSSADQSASAIAVLCHPHPQYGGSMHDAVLSTAAGVLTAHGVDCVRFNFRGVGASEGSFDNGVGEQQDVLAVAAWARNEYPERQLWLVGYSFGAAMTWQTIEQIAPQRTILIAPPVGMMDFAALPEPPGKVLAIAGDQDNFVNTAAFSSWPGVATRTIQGADHFFMGHHEALAGEIEGWLDAK